MRPPEEDTLAHVLHAPEPVPAAAARMRLFGQFVGAWDIASRWLLPDGRVVHGRGEVHYGWILGGAAIQDVWRGRIDDPPEGFPHEASGTTLRFPGPERDAWRVVWVEPEARLVQTFLARQAGDEIVLEGRTRRGLPERWIYSDVAAERFLWRAEESPDEGRTWRVTQRVEARRRGARLPGPP